MSSQREWTPPQEFDEYRLVRLLGKGTMGQVYLAHDRVLDRPVAVKFVTALDPSARERFLVEARAAARLQHPNVMAIYRVGELDQRPFLINEYIRGKSLAELELPVPWRRALELGLGLARGLAAAHRQGVLHRDIKLANAMVSERGEVKLLDFSLAKIEGVPLAEQQRPRRDLDNPTARFEGPGQKTLLQRPGVDRHGDTMLAGQAMQPSILDSSAAVRITQMGMPVQAVPPSAVTRRFDREFADDDFEGRAELTADGTLLGTPNYMAPELWRAEPASRRSDVYALGILLYTLCSGRPPHEAKNAIQLASRVQENDPRPLLERCPAVDPRLAAVIDRCIRRDPGDRWASGEELRAALEALVPVGREGYVPTGNPYRGLQAFEAEHRELFFGRAAEVQAVVDRLRAQPFVLVAGDSGVGKSSLCRAGVLPLIGDGGFDAERSWHITSITPGRRPAAALIAALAGGLGLDEESFMGHAKVEPDALDRALRRELGRYRGRVIFIDQLEELVTIAKPVEAALAARLLARIAAGIDGVRLLATARGDFLTRIAQLPGFGEELARSLYFLSPLTEEGMRLAIVGPAQLQHVSFESEGLVDRLVVAGVEGSLPLLQFALAELWEARQPPGDYITAAALDKIGGVSGALARHADGVLSRLGPRERKAARGLLLRLVTIDSTRAKLTEEELVNGDADRTALEALIAARLVVARDVTDGPIYELAHEALIHGWVTLQVWLEEEKEARLAHHRLAHAAAEWERVGKPRDGLWGEHQLVEARLIESQSLRPRELAFLTASHDRLRKRRRARRALLTAAPLAAVLAFSGVRYAQKLDIDRRVDAHTRSAAAFLREARKHEEEVERHRMAAFAKFDARDRRGGEQSWALARTGAPSVDRLHNRAARELETALSLDGDRPEVRAMLADVLYERALFAERNHRSEQTDDFLSRLQLYDDAGERMQRWTAQAQLHIDTTPSGAHVAIAPYERLPDGAIRPGEAKDLGATPVADLSLPAGSYLLTFDAPGYAPVRYPVLLARGERLELGIEMLAAADVPPDFVYVAAGRSLFGTPGDDDLRRDFFTAVPQHEVYTEGYLIAAHEVTYAQWIDYLESLDDEQRAARMTKSDGAAFQQAPALSRLDDGGWQIAFQVGPVLFTARAGDSLRFPRRRHHAVQDWLRFPVTGITWDDARAYLQWLDATGRVPGARPCTEVEWERAARGADARRFPTGDDVRPDEANIDETFARDLTAMGPTEVGSFAASESPFGLYDMTGNVWEWAASSVVPGEAVARGGAFFFAKLTGAAVNRNGVEASFRDGTLGLRVCATPRFRT